MGPGRIRVKKTEVKESEGLVNTKMGSRASKKQPTGWREQTDWDPEGLEEWG